MVTELARNDLPDDVEIVDRAEAGLMAVFGLQEIAATIEVFGSEEMKARLLPRFARGEVDRRDGVDRAGCRF